MSDLTFRKNYHQHITYNLFCILYADLEQDGFSKNPFFHGIIAEVPEQHKTKEGEGETIKNTVNFTTVTSNRICGSYGVVHIFILIQTKKKKITKQ